MRHSPRSRRHWLRSALWLSIVCCARAPAQQPAVLQVDVVPHEALRRVDITVDGKPFTSYIYPTTLKKPTLYPVRSASGTVVTRGWPLEPRPGERVDHPHQGGRADDRPRRDPNRAGSGGDVHGREGRDARAARRPRTGATSYDGRGVHRRERTCDHRPGA